MFSPDAQRLFKRIYSAYFAKSRPAFVILAFAFLGFVPNTASPQKKASSPNFAALSKRAADARDADRLEEAAALYTKALGLRPNWVEGWWSLGTLEYDQDHYAKAAIDFQKVIALDPANGTGHAMLGLCQFELGKDAPALKHLLEAQRLRVVKDEQLRHVALYHLGVLQLRTRKYGDAKRTLNQLAKDGIRSKELIAALGLAALLARPEDAPAQGTPGASVIERSGEAEALLAAKEFEPAKEIYTRLTAEFPEYPNLHFAFGKLLMETHETERAIDEFQKELKRDPQNVNSLLEIAAVRYRVDSQDGLKYAEQAVKLAPEIPFGHYLLGLLLLDTGDFQAAIQELELARKRFSNEASIYFALGNAYARAGRKAEAAEARETFKRLDKGERAGDSSEGINVSPSGDAKQDNMRGASDAKPPA
jgi:tetratricopeptide (TPR) repeat protein